MAKVSVSTPAFSATARVFTRPSCTFHSSSFRRGAATKQAVKETVSLRDLAATIVDLAGLEAGRRFPGYRWHGSGSSPRGGTGPASIRFSRARRGGPEQPAQSRFLGVPEQLPPLGAVKERDWSYIRREGDVREELFHLREDPKEQRNLAGDPAAQTTLRQMRAALDRLTGGPLLPERFKD